MSYIPSNLHPLRARHGVLVFRQISSPALERRNNMPELYDGRECLQLSFEQEISSEISERLLCSSLRNWFAENI